MPLTAPAAIALTYTITYDLPPAADQVCGITGVCDCTATWTGAGSRVAETLDGEGRLQVEFRGTWKVDRGRCNDAFLLWTPADGAAWHTLTFAQTPEGGTRLVAWVGHAREEDAVPFTTDIRARGQVWLTGMDAVIRDADHTAVHQEDARGPVGPFTLASHHVFTAVLTP